MGAALADKPQISTPQPSGIVSVKIDSKTGFRVAPNQPGIYEIFRVQNIPDFMTEGALPIDTEEPLPEDLF
jgi:penicillin-binding protein 1A